MVKKSQLNPKYIPKSLTTSDLNKQIQSIRNQTDRPKVKSLRSDGRNWVKDFEKKYGIRITNTDFISKHIIKKQGIEEILKKGRGAYYSSGSRPNQTPHSWAYARLASVILNGNAREIDNDIWEKYRIIGKNNYDDIVNQFKPNLSPRQIFLLGSFGGTYWRPIYSAVTKKKYKNSHKKYPKSWWKNIPSSHLTTDFENYNKSINKYDVKVGTTLEYWESKSWINESHPYGWVQWYCDWTMGKRCEDDIRQIKRWLGVAGEKGRFRRRLVNMIQKKGGLQSLHDYSISPSIRQTLQHWGYQVNEDDF